uniref:Reverse transcriptase domain-containing protein n=1 Tax=Tanacetum cinerariifolium TaxID=118510 RepID=A0A699IGM2_TANCI|nr:hypothetical protein [Tanacetum cinerariifolium]
MSVNELRYNLRRMWSRHGFKGIIDFNNGIYLIKFYNDEGLNHVVDNGPWMTTKGISALASRVGKLMVMDQITATLCKEKMGRFRFTRVLVEVSASKPLPNKIKVVYKNRHTSVRCSKKHGEEAADTVGKDANMETECLNVNEMMGMDGGILSDCWFKHSLWISRYDAGISESMLCELRTANSNRRVFCTIVYAANGGMERRMMWIDLMVYKGIVGNKAWFLMGNMNVTLFPNVHSTGCSHMTSDMGEFRDYVNSIEMEDISSSGLFYTWTKNFFKVKARDTSGVLKKLDRIMGNKEFIDKFSQAYAIFLPYIISDHCPNVLVFPNSLQATKKAFKFANFVVNKEDFIPIVRKYWIEDHNGCHMFKTVKKLRNIKKDLKKLTLKDGNSFDKVKSLRDHLKEIQTKVDKDPDNKLLREAKSKVLAEYVDSMRDEEKLLFFKSKISDEEIKNVMFSIYSNKAPGPDGFSSLFFKKAWSIVGKDVCIAVKYFFDNGKIPREINSTIISLVPKILTPNKVTDFRPIACCNVLYKCISKIITERMKIGLGKIIGLNQSAFVPNRNVQDNILLSQELLKGHEKKDGPSRVAMKIDIQKAYDTVNWQFFEVILKGFGFHYKMVNWIIKCVTTTSFCICVNGESFGYFKGGICLRQGDPMSPYMFTLVMEILTLIVEKIVEGSREFKYHFGHKEMKLTHICFVDDLMMFSHGDT